MLGFDPSVANGATQLYLFKCFFSLAPLLFYAMAVVLIVGYPITKRSHARIREALAKRDVETQAGAGDPQPVLKNAAS